MANYKYIQLGPPPKQPRTSKFCPKAGKKGLKIGTAQVVEVKFLPIESFVSWSLQPYSFPFWINFSSLKKIKGYFPKFWLSVISIQNTCRWHESIRFSDFCPASFLKKKDSKDNDCQLHHFFQLPQPNPKFTCWLQQQP